MLLLLMLVVSCASTPTDEEPAYTGPSLAFERQDDALVFGPFASTPRGTDYFWLPGGQELLLVVPADTSYELWLIDPGTGDSRLLRTATVEALFPIAWRGSNALLSLDIGDSNMAFNVAETTWNQASSSTTTLLPGSGRAIQHAVSADARWVSIFASGPDGGQIVRLDTEDESIVTLRQHLPSWDGLFPVWFSPDGLHAVLPTGGSWPLDLELLSIPTGRAHTFTTALSDCDRIFWNTSGTVFAYKYADGRHRVCTLSDMNLVLSRSVRIHDTAGDLVWDIELPHQGSIGDLHWLDEGHLLLVESDSEEYREKAFWVADLASHQVREATAQEAELRFDYSPYPMPKGESTYRLEIEQLPQDEGTPSELVRIMP